MSDEELRNLVASNARTAQAILSSMAEARQERQELREGLLALNNEMREFKQEMREFKEEMREFKEEMKEFRQEFREGMAITRDEMKQFRDGMVRYQENMEEVRDAIVVLREVNMRLANAQQGMARWLDSIDQDRPVIFRQLNSIENKVDQLLARQPN